MYTIEFRNVRLRENDRPPAYFAHTLSGPRYVFPASNNFLRLVNTNNHTHMSQNDDDWNSKMMSKVCLCETQFSLPIIILHENSESSLRLDFFPFLVFTGQYIESIVRLKSSLGKNKASTRLKRR